LKPILVYLLRRTLVLLVSLLLFASLLFVFFWIPDDGQMLVPRSSSPDRQDEIVDDLKLDESLPVQYANALYKLFTLKFFMSQSYRPSMNVSVFIWDTIGFTLLIFLSSAIVSVLLGTGLSIATNASRSRYPTLAIKGLCLLSLCTPLALIALYVDYSAGQYIPYDPSDSEAWRLSRAVYSIPAVVFSTFGLYALGSMVSYTRQQPDSPGGRSRPAHIPFDATSMGLLLAWSMACVLLIEPVVRVYGTGFLLFEGFWLHDYQLIISCSYLIFFIVAVSLFLMDTSYALWANRKAVRSAQASATSPPSVSPEGNVPVLAPAVTSAYSLGARMDGLLKEYMKHRAGVIAIGFIVVLLVLTVLAPVLSTVPGSPLSADSLEPTRPPDNWINPLPPDIDGSPYTGLRHPLGTDARGADVYSLLLYGARIPVVIVIGAAILSLLLGCSALVCAAYTLSRSNWLSKILRGTAEVLSSTFIAIPLMLSVVMFSGYVVWGYDAMAFSEFLFVMWFSLFAWSPIWKRVMASATDAAGRPLPNAGTEAFRESLWKMIRSRMWLVVRVSKLTVVIALLSHIMAYFFGWGYPGWREYTWAYLMDSAWQWGAFAYGAWWVYLPVSLAILALGVCAYVALSTLEKTVRPRD